MTFVKLSDVMGSSQDVQCHLQRKIKVAISVEGDNFVENAVTLSVTLSLLSE